MKLPVLFRKLRMFYSEDCGLFIPKSVVSSCLYCRLLRLNTSRRANARLLSLYIVSLFFIFPLSLRSAINHFESCREFRVLIVTVRAAETESHHNPVAGSVIIFPVSIATSL